MREGIEIIKRMWTEDAPSYAGCYYQIREAPCDPKPVQKPHPPITIGGGGEKYTLKVVAAHADRWSYPRGDVAIFKRKLDVLKTHCLRLGRNPDEIDMTFYSHDTHVYDNEEELVKTLKGMGTPPRPRRGRHLTFEEYLNQTKQNSVIGTVEECRTKIKEIRTLGINHVIFRFTQPESLEQIRRFTEEVIRRS
jgi:alkanesulfonate monooxygenase SsuD/methylene tetrahydromethanopterin reductase-like flavin-dependent oxidoreductase (luciferase family)